jgi:hypothetical protein
MFVAEPGPGAASAARWDVASQTTIALRRCRIYAPGGLRRRLDNEKLIFT